MSSVRILTVSEGQLDASLGDDPFKWDVEIEQTGGGRIESLDSPHDDVAPAMADERVLASSVENLGRDRWFDKVIGFASKGQVEKEQVGFGEIEVKRNDLWESDWDVQVAASERLNLEPLEERKPDSKSWIARWIRLCFGERVGSEDR